MYTANMKKEEKKNKSAVMDLAEYKLPEVRKLNKIYDTVPRTIAKTGFDIFNYESVFADEKTQELIRTGNTIGCFYIESPGMRSLLKRTDCRTFEMLTAVSSIIRPGVAESGMMKEFIERHKDPKRRKYLVPEMEKYLGETYGVMVYQEDVIKVAHHIVGLTLEESDLLRRAMSGKMRSHKAMQLVVDKVTVMKSHKNYGSRLNHLPDTHFVKRTALHLRFSHFRSRI
jgi:DNA polymerase III alpha subunit